MAANVDSGAMHNVDLVVVILWVPPISKSMIFYDDEQIWSTLFLFSSHLIFSDYSSSYYYFFSLTNSTFSYANFNFSDCI